MPAFPSFIRYKQGSEPGGGFSPIDNANVVEVYNAWDTSRHTYVAARVVDQYSVTSEVATVRTTAVHGFLVDDVLILADIATGVSGEKTVVSVPTTTTITVAATGVGDIGDTAVTGSANWRDRKVSAVLGMRGLYSFTQATLANMPQWNATTKLMYNPAGRSYFLGINDAIRNSLNTPGQSRSVIIVASRDSTSSAGSFYGANTTSGNTFSGVIFNASQNIQVRKHDGSALDWNIGSNYGDGVQRIYVVSGTNAPRRECFVNNMTTPVSESDLIRWTSGGGETLSLAIFRTVSNYAHASVNLIIFMTGAIADLTYRTNVKAWAEAQRGSAF